MSAYVPLLNEIAIAPTVAGYPSATGSYARVQFQSLVPGQSLSLYLSLLDSNGTPIANASAPVTLDITNNHALSMIVPMLLAVAVTGAGLTTA